MPRKLRVQYPGAIHHVMSRGDRREDIFLDDVDRRDFPKTLAEACQKTDWQVHAYCLMSNHFHLVVETLNANLVAGMRWLQSAYTIRLNHRYKLFGHVFSGRYKALLVEGSGGGYLAEKLAIALRLRRETSLSLKSIAARLHPGTLRNTGVRLGEWVRNRASGDRDRQAELGL